MADAMSMRKQRKAKKPTFTRQDSHKKKRIDSSWRKPRGLHSKVRLKKRGYVRSPDSGWRAPRAVRGLDPSGLVPVRVANLSQLARIDPAREGAMICASVGDRKRKAIIEAAQKRSIRILNKPVASLLKRITDALARRAEVKAARRKARESKEKKPSKQKAEQEKEPKGSEAGKPAAKTLEEDDEKRRAELKRERDKVLTKRV